MTTSSLNGAPGSSLSVISGALQTASCRTPGVPPSATGARSRITRRAADDDRCDLLFHAPSKFRKWCSRSDSNRRDTVSGAASRATLGCIWPLCHGSKKETNRHDLMSQPVRQRRTPDERSLYRIEGKEELFSIFTKHLRENSYSLCSKLKIYRYATFAFSVCSIYIFQ